MEMGDEPEYFCDCIGAMAMSRSDCDAKDTELTRLRAEVETLNQRLGACQGGYELAEQEVKQLRATLARLEADAGRLEWLADPANAVRVMGNDERGWSVCDMSDGLVFLSRGCKSMREAIDAATALSAPTGKGEA
jgi:hypothetical protein